ncbi:glycosyl transferase [Brucella intermedia]|uniref:glycosyl transferase n=1 Tax=Brucella intermedia TaxID=94625 RepID=UPI00165D1004|nr:glycosyl transferase [Brucella intermedia]QNQ41352.1 glycosyl transferase [Brucella intermedia]
MKNLLYLSPVPYKSFAQRPHKFVNWFHQRYGGRVVWIDPYATRFPVLADLRRLVRQSDEIHTSDLTPEWLTVICPDGLPIEPMPGAGYLNSRLWRSAFTEAISLAKQNDCVTVIGKPSVLAIKIMKALRGCRLIYDAMDDFPAFYQGFSRTAMKNTEIKIASLVDVIWVSSTTLYERWSSQQSNVRLLYNGLDFDIISSAEPQAEPSDRTIFGYLGTIGNWFDWEMITALARVVPHDLIRIHGPIYKKPSGKLPSNIELFPPSEHAEAITQMTHFDVGLIPFLKNELTGSVDPIKYYEYRAFGIPVLSSYFGEMRYRGRNEGVYVVHDLAELEKVVAEARNNIQARRLDQMFAQENSWAARFDQIIEDF